jgi:hypothetical protein
VKIYIAGPMTGIEQYNYPAFYDAACQLALLGFEPVNPATTGVRRGKAYGFYIKAGIELLMQASAVACLDNWEESNGAKLEVEVARAMGQVVAPLKFYLEDPSNAWYTVSAAYQSAGHT